MDKDNKYGNLKEIEDEKLEKIIGGASFPHKDVAKDFMKEHRLTSSSHKK